MAGSTSPPLWIIRADPCLSTSRSLFWWPLCIPDLTCRSLALRLYTVFRRGHQAHYKQASDILIRVPELEARKAVSQAFSRGKAGHGFGGAERTTCHAAAEEGWAYGYNAPSFLTLNWVPTTSQDARKIICMWKTKSNQEIGVKESVSRDVMSWHQRTSLSTWKWLDGHGNVTVGSKK